MTVYYLKFFDDTFVTHILWLYTRRNFRVWPHSTVHSVAANIMTFIFSVIYESVNCEVRVAWNEV
jgi:hypothetical protein